MKTDILHQKVFDLLRVDMIRCEHAHGTSNVDDTVC